MRPVNRGAAPRCYSNYRKALGDLECRLGTYCSYCEIRLPQGLAVEHKAPKSLYPERELEWTDFLLACQTCNSIKGDADTPNIEMLWPDEDNTASALTYSEGGFVDVALELDPHSNERTRSLIDLVGLDRHEANGRPGPIGRDKRWSERERNWQVAKNCRSKFERLGESDDALQWVLQAAEGFGFFSVWMTVFSEHPLVLTALLDVFPGTARDHFDQNGNSIPWI